MIYSTLSVVCIHHHIKTSTGGQSISLTYNLPKSKDYQCIQRCAFMAYRYPCKEF